MGGIQHNLIQSIARTESELSYFCIDLEMLDNRIVNSAGLYFLNQARLKSHNSKIFYPWEI